MKILLSNDDGYEAPGIRCLQEHLAGIATQLVVVAPERDRSGASNSLTLDRPLRATEVDDGVIRVNGTPTDCVHLAITGLLDFEPDIVISGINAGANMGDDVLYSGTVAAAMEGRFLGFPSIAVSLCGTDFTHYATAAEYVTRLMGQLDRHPLPTNTILNVNVPDCPLEQVRGVQATRLGHRHKAEPVIKMDDPRGRPIYWIGPAGKEQDAGEGTDFFSLSQNAISVTPLHVDLTRYHALDKLAGWLAEGGEA